MPLLQTNTQKQNNVKTNNLQAKSATPITIFQSNFLISLITLIPILGWSYLLAVMWKTGMVIASYNQPFYWILENPFAWIELTVYSFAILQSIKLFKIAKQKTRTFWFTFTTTITTMAFILFISALVEYVFIH